MSGVTWTNGHVAGQVIKKTPQNLGVVAHAIVNAQRVTNQLRMCNADGRVCKGFSTFGYNHDAQWTSAAVFDNVGIEQVIDFSTAPPSSKDHWSQPIVQRLNSAMPGYMLDPSATRLVDNLDKLIIRDATNTDITDAVKRMSQELGHIMVNRHFFPLPLLSGKKLSASAGTTGSCYLI